MSAFKEDEGGRPFLFCCKPWPHKTHVPKLDGLQIESELYLDSKHTFYRPVKRMEGILVEAQKTQVEHYFFQVS